MIQRKLLVFSLSLTMVLGWLFFAVPTAEAQTTPTAAQCRNAIFRFFNPGRCTTPRPTASPRASSTPTPTSNPSSNPTPGSTSTPNPTGAFSPAGKLYTVKQKEWKKLTSSTTVPIEKMSRFETGKVCDDYSGGKATKPLWSNFSQRSSNIRLADSGATLRGTRNADLESAYLISSPFSTDAQTAQWKEFSVLFKRKDTNTIKLAYRVGDRATTDQNDSSWLELSDPTTASTKRCGNFYLTTYRVDVVGKVFQYKVNLVSAKADQDIRQMALTAQPGTLNGNPTPTPTGDPSANPTGNPSSQPSGNPTTNPSSQPTGVGKVTIMTKYIVDSRPTLPSGQVDEFTGSSGPALPDLGDSTTNAGTTPVTPISYCSDLSSAEPAAEVSFSGKLTGGSTSFLDQQTDIDGTWRGIDGEVDEFPSGTYTVNFGDFNRSEYKLVDFCVSPDDGQHHLQSQTDPVTKKATIIVKPGQETKLTAVYGIRSKPYITLNKFAVDGPLDNGGAVRKVMRIVYPGQSFLYRVDYTNSGESDASNVVILDVLASELAIPEDQLDVILEKYGISVQLDAKRRTLIKKTVGTLKKGETGSMYIPVTLRADAFEGSNLVGS